VTEAHTEVTLTMPRPAHAGAGLSFNPRSQLNLFDFRPAIKIVGTADIGPIQFCSANPMRVMWTLTQLIGSAGFGARPEGSAFPALWIGASVYDIGLPIRVHCAEWPGVCQAAWYVGYGTSLDTNGSIWEFREVVSG